MPLHHLGSVVTFGNVMIDGSPREFSYDVIIIDPDKVVATPTPTRTPTPSPTPPSSVAMQVRELFDMSAHWYSLSYGGLADVNGDNQVNEADLFLLITNWRN